MRYLVKINTTLTKEQLDKISEIVAEKDIVSKPIPNKLDLISFDNLLKEIIKSEFDVTDEVFEKKTRRSNYSTIRYLRAYYIYKYMALPMLDCAKYCGYSDHTAIVRANESISNILSLVKIGNKAYKTYDIINQKVKEIIDGI